VTTVSAVDEASPSKADHAPYIAAVCRDLEARDVWVADTLVWNGRDGLREATLLLQFDADAFPVVAPGPVRVRWNEEDGWSVLVHGESAAGRVYKGLDVVPDPEDVAAWVVVALTRPDLTLSREDHPYRDHSVPDASFEAQLAGYAPLG
jgi:hypothetical protein